MTRGWLRVEDGVTDNTATRDDRPDAPTRGPSVAVRLAAAAGLALFMLAGILVLGRVASTDIVAMALTTVFFLVVAGGVFLVVRRSRSFLVPLGAVYLVVAGGATVVLGLPLVTDDVVDEDVVQVETSSASEPGDDESLDAQDSTAAQESDAGPQAIATGGFEPRAHPGEGTATLVDTGEGTVLTLTDFATDNGPDLLVYLVPADAPADSVDGFVDLGTLKGNVGDQQYDVPADVDAGAGWRVVVWCRAFAVSFTEAALS